MTKNSSAAKGFLGSLLLLIAALLVFFLVLSPGKKSEVKGNPDAAPVAKTEAAAASRASVRASTPRAASEARPAQTVAVNGGPPAPALPPQDEDPDVQKAINLIDSGNIQEAMQLLEGVLKRDPKCEQALVEMAMVNLLDLKQPEQATGYLQKVMEINPGNQIVLSELVSLYEEQGKLDEGLNFLLEVNGKNPGSPELSYGIGQLLSLQGRDAEAVAYLDKATQSPENEVRAFRDLGEAYARTGDSEKAIDSFSKAISTQEKELADKSSRGLPVQFIQERIAYTRMDMARELIRQGQTDEAQQLLDQVKTIMPTDEAVTALQETLNRRRAG